MEDWTVLIRAAIAVLVVLTAIAIIIFLTFLGLNSANRGGERLAESVGALDARAMEIYDQKTVSGGTALAAVRNYRNTSIAVVVVTNGTVRNYNAQIGTIDAAGVFTPAFTTAGAPGGNAQQVFQLNAGGNSEIAHGLKLNANFVMKQEEQHLDIRSATDSGMNEFINTSAKFRSCIIYNANDEAIGIYLRQTTAPATIVLHAFLVP
jgi:hypothetical protein